MNVDLRQLRAFIAVARHGSFSRAAQAVHLSQPALSLLVRNMESELGLRLLDRTTRQVALSAVGEALLPAAERILGELEATLREVKELGQQGRGRVTVASVASVSGRLLPEVLIRCRARFPHIRVNLLDDAASNVLNRVRIGEAEIGLSSGWSPDPDLTNLPIMRDPFLLLCRADSPFAAKPAVAWRDLAGQRFIAINTTSGSRQLVDVALANAGVEVDTVLELSHLSSIYGMVDGGVGIVALPALALPALEHSSLTTRPLVDPPVFRTIHMVTRNARSLSPAAASLCDVIIDCGRRASLDR